MHQKADKAEVEESSEEENNNNQSPLRQIYNFLFVGKAPVWTALATVMMMVFSGLLLRVTNIANQISVSTQRAVLSPNGPSIIKQNAPDGKSLKGVNIGYFWANAGTMPARDGKAQFNIYIGDAHPVTGLDFSKLPQSRVLEFVLGPKNAIQLETHFVGLEDLDNVTDGKTHMFFWGWAIYHDGFPDTPLRLSEFCADITGITWTKTPHSDPTTDLTVQNPPCETHNCYDEACDDYGLRTR